MTLLATFSNNETASLCHQVASLDPDMFCNFYFVKNHKIANNSATAEAGEKISTSFLDVRLFKFENYQIKLATDF